MMNDDSKKYRREVYDYLSRNGYTDSFEMFDEDMNDEKRRREFYDYLSQNGLTDDYDTFSGNIGGHEPAPEAQATVAAPRDKIAGNRTQGAETAEPAYVMSEDELGEPGEYDPDAEKTPRLMPTESWEQTMAGVNRTIARSGERMKNMMEYGKTYGYGDTKKGPVQLNVNTGKAEQTYLTPMGGKTTDKAEADWMSHDYRMFREQSDMSVAGQLRRAERQLAELEAKADEKGRELIKKQQEVENSRPLWQRLVIGMTENNKPTGMQPMDGITKATLNDNEYQMLSAAIADTKKTIETLRNRQHVENGGDQGFWRTFGQTISDPTKWDFGMTDLRHGMAKLSAAQLAESGTEEEKAAAQAVMQAQMGQQTAEEMYGDFGAWSRWGGIAGEALPFVADFVMTGGGFEGVNMLGGKAAAKAANMAVKAGVKEGAKSALRSYIKKDGLRGLASGIKNFVKDEGAKQAFRLAWSQDAAPWMVKALGTTADELLVRAPLLTNTIQAGKTAADIVERKLGRVEQDMEKGTLRFENGKSWGDAVWQAEANAIIENYSEMFGTHIDAPIEAIAGKLGNVFGAKRLTEAVSRMDASGFADMMKSVSKFMEKNMGVSGYFGEVGEEYYGQLLRTVANLDDAKNGEGINNFLDPRFHGDIWAGMALSIGQMKAVPFGTAAGVAAKNYVQAKQGMKLADINATEILGQSTWEPLRNIIDNTSNDQFGAVVEYVANDGTLNNDERAAVLDYMGRSMVFRGLNLGDLALQSGEAEKQKPYMEDLNRSWMDGYNMADTQEMQDVKDMLDYQRVSLAQRLGIRDAEDLDEQMGDPVAFIEQLWGKNVSNDDIQRVIDYANAKMVYEGMAQRVRDDIDSRVAQSNAMIESRTRQDGTGMVQEATMKADDRKVYVVGGTINMTDDGSMVSRETSDDTIIVRDAETGKLEMVSPEAVSSVETAVFADDLKREAEEQIRQQGEAAAEAIMNGGEVKEPAAEPQGTDAETAQYNRAEQDAEAPTGPTAEENSAVENEKIAQTAETQQERQAVQPQPAAAPVVVPVPKAEKKTAMYDKGQEIYSAVPVERTIEEFYSDGELDTKDVAEMIEEYRKKAAEVLKKLEDTPPKAMANRAAFVQAKRNYAAAVAEAQHEVEYWDAVKAENDRITHINETPLAGNDNASIDLTPKNGVEYASTFLAKGRVKIDPQSDTNLGSGDRRGFVGLWARPENGGVSVDHASEMLAELDETENGGAFFHGDSTQAKEAIMELLASTETLGDINSYIRDGETERMKREAEAAENELRAYIEENEKMSLEDYLAYEETLIPAIIEQYHNVNEQEYDNFVAEKEIERQENDNNGTIERSDSVLPRQAHNDTRGTEQGESGGQADGAGRPGNNQDAAVQGDYVQERSGEGVSEASAERGKLRVDDGRGDNGRLAERQGGLAKTEEIDENGHPFVVSLDGTTTFGEIRENSGLTPAPIKLSKGYQDENGKGYGLDHIEANHGKQIRNAGFASVEDFVAYVAQHYDEDNIRVGKRRSNGNPTYLLQVTDEHDNTLFVELSQDGSYWNVNSAGIFRKGYANKKETVAKTEPQQPNNAVPNGSSLSESREGGIMPSEPNGEPTVSEGKGTNNAERQQGNEGKSLLEDETDAELNDPWGIAGRVAEQEDDWEEEGAHGTVYKRTVLVDGKYKVVKVDFPSNDKKEYRTRYEFDGKEFGDLKEVTDYINKHSVQTAIEAASAEVNTEPTPAQKEAGNYKMGHVKIGNFDITIENPKGSVRRGTDANGKAWSVTMNNTYGYIRGTEGVDGDHIDVFLSDEPDKGDVFVVDQYNPDGTFDEHKVMYGFASPEEARAAYLSNYSDGWENGRRIDISHVSKDEFKKWVDSSHRKTKAFAEYKGVKVLEAEADEYGSFLGGMTDEELQEELQRSRADMELGLAEDINEQLRQDVAAIEAEMQRRGLQADMPFKTEDGDVRFRDGEGAQGEAVADAVSAEAAKLNLGNVEVLTDTSGLKGRKARARGWYDTKTGKIVIVLPNHADARDAVRTLLHEGVAHHGLREMFGEEFDKFLDDVYKNAGKEIKEAIDAEAYGLFIGQRMESAGTVRSWGECVREATEEYMARLAESSDFENMKEGMWQKIKNLFRELLKKVGINIGDALTDNDLRYILRRSYMNLKGKGRDYVGMAEDVVKDAEMREELGINERFRFIGEKGARNADAADSGVCMENLRVAEEMEKADKDAKAVKLATGWERGADGKWRYEEADFKIDASGKARKNSLWSNLPWGKEYDALLDKMFPENGDFGELTEQEQERFDELLQKAEDMRKLYDEAEMRYLDDYVVDDILFKEYPDLKKVKVEMFNDSDSGIGGQFVPDTNTIRINIAMPGEMRSTFIHEVQHAIQHIEGFARGGNESMFERDGTFMDYVDAIEFATGEKVDISGVDKFEDFRDIVDGLAEKHPEDMEALAKARGFESIKDMVLDMRSPFEKYQALAGEVEARNAERRRDMTDAERRKILAEETEDVPRDEQIVRFGEGANASVQKQSDGIREGEDYLSYAERVAKEYMEKQKQGKPSLLDAVNTLYQQGKEAASKKYQMTFFDVAKTPAFMKEIGLTGDKFTVRYGVIARHFGKDSEHDLPSSVWEQLPEALQKPFAITKYFADEEKKQQKGYRLYTTLQLPNGSYVVVSAEVKNAGKDIEVNAINTIFGRDAISKTHDEIVYVGENITPEQKALLNGNNPHQYPDVRESFSAAKVADDAETAKGNVENVAEEAENDGGVLFRDGEGDEHRRTVAAQVYEQRVKKGMYQAQEALQDSMLGLEKAMLSILEAEGSDIKYIEDVDGSENPYLAENRLSSVNQAEAEAFARLLFAPMLDEVAKLAKDGKEREALTEYMMAKHGLERNEVMARRDFEAYKAEHPSGKKTLADFRDRDYAGLTALTGNDDVADAEAEARKMVATYETAHDTTELWQRVNAVNRATLSKLYECNLLTDENYAKIKGMYQYYIPLRGFDEKTSADAYAYLNNGASGFNAPIKRAEGRKSMADDPLAYMQSMADSAIMQGNRNKLVKLAMLRFALKHPSDLVSVSDMWLEYNAKDGVWEVAFPEIKTDDSPAEVARKMKEFDERMQTLAEKEPDKYKKGRDARGIPYRVVGNNELHQHQVVVKRRGMDVVLTINGNPRAAQALNGLTNPDNESSGSIGKTLHAIGAVNRTLSSLYTTMSPDFVASNFIRDTLYANKMVWVKESPKYAYTYNKTYLSLNPATMKMLFQKYRKGTLDLTKEREAMFYQFMRNGGETGFLTMSDIDQHKKKIKKALNSTVGEDIATWIGEIGRAIETQARFAAFITSRKMGRSIDRAIWDAKEVSVNFNKKGAGDKFLGATGQTALGNAAAFTSGMGRALYVFWNAALQGTFGNYLKNAKRHPAKAMADVAVKFGLAFLIAALGASDDDDDKKKEVSYHDLPDYVRRSNIVFKGRGKAWVKIPLPIEDRAIYGLGELAGSVIFHGEELTAGKMAAQMSQLLPIDMLEGQKEGDFSWTKPLWPSSAKPAVEAENNVGWTGMPIYRENKYNKDMPEWTKAFDSTNPLLVSLAETLNEATGGDKYEIGGINMNPAKIEYLLKGYTGGLYTFANQLVNIGAVAMDKKDFDWRYIPLANRVLMNGDENAKDKALNRRYWNYKNGEYAHTEQLLRGYKREAGHDVMEYAEKLSALVESPEYRRYEIAKKYESAINALNRKAKDADEEREKKIAARIVELKKEMLSKTGEVKDGDDTPYEWERGGAEFCKQLRRMQQKKMSLEEIEQFKSDNRELFEDQERVNRENAQIRLDNALEIYEARKEGRAPVEHPLKTSRLTSVNSIDKIVRDADRWQSEELKKPDASRERIDMLQVLIDDARRMGVAAMRGEEVDTGELLKRFAALKRR